MAENNFLIIDGVRIHYVVAGDGPPLLLLHGLGAGSITWALNIEPLSQKYTVYALDVPGLGDSDKPNMDYNIKSGALSVKRFIESLEIEHVSLAGCSMGGMIALKTAIDFPNMVDNLILVDAAGLGKNVTWLIRVLSIPVIGEILENPSLRRTRAYLKSVFYNQKLVQNGILNEIHRTRNSPGAKEATLKMIRGTLGLRGIHDEWIMTEHMKNLDIPVLIIWGAKDMIIPVQNAYNAVYESPSIKLCVFDRCGHWPQMEKSTEFNKLVISFLNKY